MQKIVSRSLQFLFFFCGLMTSVDGAHYIKGLLWSTNPEGSAESWTGFLKAQRYGQLFESLDSSLRAADQVSKAKASTWIVDQVAQQEIYDPFIYYMHARIFLKQAGKADSEIKPVDVYVSIFLCLALIRISENTLYSWHVLASCWLTNFMKRKMLEEYRCLLIRFEMQIEEATTFDKVKKTVSRILKDTDILKKMAAPLWLRDVTRKNLSFGWGLEWPDLGEHDANIKTDPYVGELFLLVMKSAIDAEVLCLEKCDSWENFLEQNASDELVRRKMCELCTKAKPDA